MSNSASNIFGASPIEKVLNKIQSLVPTRQQEKRVPDETKLEQEAELLIKGIFEKFGIGEDTTVATALTSYGVPSDGEIIYLLSTQGVDVNEKVLPMVISHAMVAYKKESSKLKEASETCTPVVDEEILTTVEVTNIVQEAYSADTVLPGVGTLEELISESEKVLEEAGSK